VCNVGHRSSMRRAGPWIACGLAVALAGCGEPVQRFATADVLQFAVQGDALQVPEDTRLDGQLTVTFQGRAILTFSIVDQPRNGRLALDATTGAFTYLPNKDFTGTDTFTFVASDGQVLSNEATVTINVLPVNDPPVANATSMELLEDSQIVGRLTATDVDSSILTFSVLTAPSHGLLDLDGLTGVFTYRPARDYNGSDAFQFVANDGELNSAPATVSITVLPVNDAPVAQDGSLMLLEDTPASGRLAATDIDSSVLKYAVVRPPAHGRVDLDAATGMFTYRPDKDFNGADSFTFIANDGELGSPPATVSLTITPVNDPPVAQDQAITVDEDTVAAGTAVATDVDSPTLTYAVAVQPAHGTVQLDPVTGSFSYRPTKDYNGTDSFRFTASDGELTSPPATVTFTINPVNDPPVLPAVPDQTNSPETRDVLVALPLRDVDGELLQYTVVLGNPSIATARVDETATLILTPHARGSTTVVVMASDGVYQATTSFNFTVTDVEKVRRFAVDVARKHAVSIANSSPSDVSFELRQNGAALATTAAQMLDEVEALPDEFSQESLQRKMWRFVRDGSYRSAPLTSSIWQHEPLVFLNSIGVGYADDIATAYVGLAEAAGYQARAWDLHGHSVPEVYAAGRWEAYDPALPVYYVNRQGQVAGVQDLGADPSLITSPQEPRVMASSTVPYGQAMADIYATTADNRLLPTSFFAWPHETAALSLPAGARVAYPGQWAKPPADVSGNVPPSTAQLSLALPAGFTGVIDWPLVLWDVQGSGRVQLGGTQYAAGSPEVTAALQALESMPQTVQILEAPGAVTLVYLINPLRFGLMAETELRLRSQDAWALEVSLTDVAIANQSAYASRSSLALGPVAPVNDPPAAVPQTVRLLEDTVSSGKVLGTDLEGSALTFALVALPANGSLTLDGLTGEFRYQPNPSFNGTDAFQFTANDGELASLPATVTLVVQPVNDAPVASGLAVELLEDGVATGRVTASDIDSPVLTFAISQMPAHGTVDLDSATGIFTYQPFKDYNGTDTFQFVANDGELNSVPATVTLDVLPVNDPPVAAPQTLTLLEDAMATGVVTANDIDSPVLTYALVNLPSNGTLSFDAVTGAFAYRPAPNFNGTDSFQFVANDGELSSTPATVTLVVQPVNDAPIAKSSSVELLEDAQLVGRVTATDVDSPVLTFALLSAPLHGTLDLDGMTGTFIYHPVKDYNGSDSFQFIANDGELNSVPATVTITVLPVNDPPVAQDGSLVLAEDAPATGRLVASDVDSPVLTYTLVQPPAHGTLDLDVGNGAFTYRPAKDYNGTDSFKFTVSDGELSSAPAIVSLTITPVNDPPVAQDQAVTLDEDTVATGTVVATDVDSTTLTYAVATPPAHGTVQLDPATGSFAYRPAKDYNGSDSFRFTASDGELTSTPATVTFTINPVNDPPELPVIPDQTNSPETRDVSVALPLRDVDGDLLQYTVVIGNPTVATARVDETATLILTPQAKGDTSVTVTASDGVYQAVASFKLTVAEVAKVRRYTIPDTQAQSLQITNTQSNDVAFTLRHGGALMATNNDQMVEEARALSDDVDGEPFERKLWRLVRDGAYHFDPPSTNKWARTALVVLNSTGFGWCGEDTATFVSLAQTGGYNARIWDLTGHVVPEIQINGRWEVYDSDQAVYYADRQGGIASVATLASDPALVTAPMFKVTSLDFPYSDSAATMYATTQNNANIGPWWWLPAQINTGTTLVLPPGAALTYPGMWTAGPIGAISGLPVPVTAQLRLDLPVGFAGTVDWPLLLWDVQGEGQVIINGVQYDAGSQAVTAALQSRTALLQDRSPSFNRVQVLGSGGAVSLVYLVNPMRFSMVPDTSLELRSMDAWALDVGLVSLPPSNRVAYTNTASVARPYNLPQ
jgi:hypothetical protein